MQKRRTGNSQTAKIVTADIDTACVRYGLGKASMRKIAEDAGAVVRIGRRYLIHLGRVDAYMESMAQ